MKSVILTLALIGAAYGHVLTCPRILPMDNFDIESYIGLWYEYSRLNYVYESDAKCATATYSFNGTGSIDILNKEIDRTREIETNGYGTLEGDGSIGQILVHFPSQPGVTTYNVLGTDYKNWAAVFSCRANPNSLGFHYASILTRTKEPGQEVVDEVAAVLEAQRLAIENFVLVNQKDC